MLASTHTQGNANTKDGDDNSKFHQNTHNKSNGLVSTNQAEGFVVQEPNEGTVDYTDKKEWRGNSDCEQSFALTGLETATTAVENAEQENHEDPGDDVEDHADLCLNGWLDRAAVSHVQGDACDTEDQSDDVEETESAESRELWEAIASNLLDGTVAVSESVFVANYKWGLDLPS